MKNRVLTLLIIICIVVNVNATVRTVCNMAYSPGQYTTFAAALTASSNYDTIYMHGSSINYGAITVNKMGICVIGTGHNPNKQTPLTSNFTTITLSAINCKLIGLTCDAINSGAIYPSGTTVKRCKIIGTATNGGISISGAGAGDNWLIEGNVFMYTAYYNINFGGSTTNNTIIRNNIFNTGNGGPPAAIFNNNSLTTTFSFLIVNNLFLGLSNQSFGLIYNAIIDNNIFYRSSPQGTSTGCAMNSNISFACTNNLFSAAGTGNLVNVNPQFVSFPLAGATFAYTHDYRLAATSPGLLTGNDGTDRGVYGGFGYKFNMTGEPAMPEIINFSITSSTVIVPGGTLNISVKSKRIQ